MTAAAETTADLNNRVSRISADFTRFGNSRTDQLDISRTNIERALAEYERVQNFNKESRKQDKGDRSFSDAGKQESLLDQLSTLGPPYDKSALLRRLLEGKTALRHPAPLSMSYPAYSFVESDVEHRVFIGFCDSQEISIDQCSYRIVGMNSSAKAMMRLLRSDAYFDGGRFLETATLEPVWTVKFGNWPAWELTVGVGNAGAGRRDSIERHCGAPASRSEALWGGWGPIQVTSVGTTGESVIDRLKRDAEKLPELLERQANGERLSLLEIAAVNWAGNLQRDLAKGALNPRSLDWLSYRQTSWVLRRSAGWRDISAKEIYLDHPVEVDQNENQESFQ